MTVFKVLTHIDQGVTNLVFCYISLKNYFRQYQSVLGLHLQTLVKCVFAQRNGCFCFKL